MRVSQLEEQTVLTRMAHWCLVLCPEHQHWCLLLPAAALISTLCWCGDLWQQLHLFLSAAVKFGAQEDLTQGTNCSVTSPHRLQHEAVTCVETMKWARCSPNRGWPRHTHVWFTHTLSPLTTDSVDECLISRCCCVLQSRCGEGETSDYSSLYNQPNGLNKQWA